MSRGLRSRRRVRRRVLVLVVHDTQLRNVGCHPLGRWVRSRTAIRSVLTARRVSPFSALAGAFRSAVVMSMDYVPMWNCTHIANAAIRLRIEEACRKLGYEPPVICTPEELME